METNEIAPKDMETTTYELKEFTVVKTNLDLEEKVDEILLHRHIEFHFDLCPHRVLIGQSPFAQLEF